MLKLRDMKDVSQLVRLGKLFWEESGYYNVPYDDDKVMMLGARCLMDEDRTTFVRFYEEDGEPIAMFVGAIRDYYFSGATFAEDLMMYVHPEHRGSIKAARLIKEFIKWAESRQVNDIELKLSAQITNETAGKLFERLGFERVGHIYKRRTV